ncbi:MAG: nuclear transport factor 2 family protein [Bacteroidota bacterium]
MKRYRFILGLLALLTFACQSPQPSYIISGPQSQLVANLIAAVNEKDAEKYVAGFAEEVEIVVEREVRIKGRDLVRANRAAHFEAHPEIRSEILHIVEIDNKVVLHDKVWLSAADQEGQDIVEIFTFQGGVVVRMEVIQPRLLSQDE